MLDLPTMEIREDDRSDRAGPSRAPIRRLALVGNALPRKCGLATFTSHVAEALARRYQALTVDHYAMDDGTGVDYPATIRTIDADEPGAYRAAARRMDGDGVEAIWLQHEYGIFGGEAGRNILAMLESSDLPLVVTLHTVLEQPSDAQRSVLHRILERADHVIVMAGRGADILTRWHGVPPHRISVIPHGAPHRPLIDPDTLKAQFGWAGRQVVMTFGLLSPDKGIADMIEALPALVERHPDLLYAVIGATHPNLARREGEAYRQSLAARAAELGVADHIEFVDSFVEQEELLDRLQASDIYVTPYRNMSQVTSGTLAYAVAVGKPVVSTPYVHAREILADDVGMLVEPGDPPALAAAIDRLFDDRTARSAMARRAYEAGRRTLWPRVVERALAPLAARPATAMPRRPVQPPPTDLPLDAIQEMSDGVGILQHSHYGVPDRHHGYCIDDNARALIVALRRFERTGDARCARLARTYAAFLGHGWHDREHAFRNFMGYDRRWREDRGSDDSNGRTLWALAVTLAESSDEGLRGWAGDVLFRALEAHPPVRSPRSKCFAAMGAYDWLRASPGNECARSLLRQAAETLAVMLDVNRRDDWAWFEPSLSYDNARLPEVMIKAGLGLDRPDLVESGVETLEWLSTRQHRRGRFRPVGSNSFCRPYAEPEPFDQQPLEAAATVDAALIAWTATGDSAWLGRADEAYAWFFGENDHGLPLADIVTGACFDGLTEDGVNRNQGAESILALHQAAEAMAGVAKVRERSLQQRHEASEATA